MTEPEILGPLPGSFEARASLGLKVLAVLNAAAVVISLFPPPYPLSWLQAATFNTVSGVLAIIYAIEAVALDRRRPWAYAAARPLMAVVAVAGLATLGLAVADGRARVPLDVVAAGWAWLGGRDPRGANRADRRTTGLLGAAVLLLVVPLTGSSVFGWGGLLDGHERDLRATLEVDCGAADAGPPSTIQVTYDWAWAGWSVFPSGTDVVVIGWTGDDGIGRPLYLLGETPPSGTGIVSGRQIDPSAAMAREVEAESDGSWHWGIVLEDQDLGPGRIEMELRATRAAPPDAGPMTITATYIHLGLWRQDTAPVTCTWAP